MTVLDEQGRPVEGATVILTTNYHPHPQFNETREVKTTDRAGIASFEQRSEWQQEVIMIHGWREYFWDWCVEKPGFKAWTTPRSDGARFNAQQTIQLSRGPSTPCPEPQEERLRKLDARTKTTGPTTSQ